MRGRAAAAGVMAAGLLLAGCAGGEQPPQSASVQQPPQQQPGQQPPSQQPPGQQAQQQPAANGKPAPRSLSIPSIGVTSTLERLGQNKDGAMETPKDPAKAGWYVPGPTPGDKGPAVIAGHVTWNGAPSVFHRLTSLKAGDPIEVEREDGKKATFEVERVAQYPKNRFPTVEVYKNIDHAGLRLITCGGQYDESQRYYSDNVVVFARLSGTG
ncbi:class F sortase [Streptomyces sp. NPDC045431]|uniref:class F sortase n=1 Tax=Streptomyces sp. NPDC045431 TaxID=3155613 RepID=UPI0033E96E62